MNKAVFLDRDGVINRNPAEHDYVKSLEELFLNPEIEDSIRYIKDQGYLVIVISNQQGIGKGLITEEILESIHQEININLKRVEAKIDAFYWCGHLKEDNCGCRKPKPGLLTQAIKDWNIDKESSFFIGDRESDLMAGKGAGIETHIVKTNSSIYSLVKEILSNE
jgi:D-glycero-D-manno-heptose 1,7-bisphosphate phosphatase